MIDCERHHLHVRMVAETSGYILTKLLPKPRYRKKISHDHRDIFFCFFVLFIRTSRLKIFKIEEQTKDNPSVKVQSTQ